MTVKMSGVPASPLAQLLPRPCIHCLVLSRLAQTNPEFEQEESLLAQYSQTSFVLVWKRQEGCRCKLKSFWSLSTELDSFINEGSVFSGKIRNASSAENFQ